jgi:hypothetical protein
MGLLFGLDIRNSEFVASDEKRITLKNTSLIPYGGIELFLSEKVHAKIIAGLSFNSFEHRINGKKIDFLGTPENTNTKVDGAVNIYIGGGLQFVNLGESPITLSVDLGFSVLGEVDLLNDGTMVKIPQGYIGATLGYSFSFEKE